MNEARRTETKREFQQNEARKWAQSQMIEDLNMRIRTHSDINKVPAKQKMRELEELGKEQEIQNFLIKDQEILSARKALEQEKQLINEIKAVQDQKHCEEKRRMQLRMNSREIREFEDKLKNAYFRKDVDKLLTEKELADRSEKEKRLKEIEREHEQILKNQMELQQQQEQIQEAKLKYREYLLKQQEDTVRSKQQDYEEFLRDKLLIDEAMRKIQIEEDMRLHEQSEKKKQALHDLTEFNKIRDSYKKRQAEELLIENEKAAEYMRNKDKREEVYHKLETEKREKFQKIQEEMRQKLVIDKLHKLELDQAREELAMEEYQKYLSEKEKAELTRKNIIRQNLREMFLDQLAIKADILRRKKEEDKEYQIYMIQKYEEAERAERFLAEDRRRKQEDYRASMEKVLADKRAQYVIQKEQERDQERKLSEMEKQYDELIKLEKIRLLKEHGKDLIGYFPKGTIQNDYEINALDPGLKDIYLSKLGPSDDSQK